MFLSMGLDGRFKSLSARRAWIEIHSLHHRAAGRMVALRKESVDRNGFAALHIAGQLVALRKESVDRNRCMQEELYKRDGRSPQGERG